MSDELPAGMAEFAKKLRGQFDNYGLPDSMWYGVGAFVFEGQRPGGFLEALFKNDLMGAFARADELNSALMHNWASFLHNGPPAGCFGSLENFEDWQRVGGWRGVMRRGRL